MLIYLFINHAFLMVLSLYSLHLSFEYYHENQTPQIILSAMLEFPSCILPYYQEEIDLTTSFQYFVISLNQILFIDCFFPNINLVRVLKIYQKMLSPFFISHLLVLFYLDSPSPTSPYRKSLYQLSSLISVIDHHIDYYYLQISLILS